MVGDLVEALDGADAVVACLDPDALGVLLDAHPSVPVLLDKPALLGTERLAALGRTRAPIGASPHTTRGSIPASPPWPPSCAPASSGSRTRCTASCSCRSATDRRPRATCGTSASWPSTPSPPCSGHRRVTSTRCGRRPAIPATETWTLDGALAPRGRRHAARLAGPAGRRRDAAPVPADGQRGPGPRRPRGPGVDGRGGGDAARLRPGPVQVELESLARGGAGRPWRTSPC